MDYHDRFEYIHGDEDYLSQPWGDCDLEEEEYQACYDSQVDERIDELKEQNIIQEEIRMISTKRKTCNDSYGCEGCEVYNENKECNDENFNIACDKENKFLFLEMKLGEKIYINNEMYIQFIKQNSPRSGSEKIRMGFHAPRHIVIDRETIYLRKLDEQQERLKTMTSANDEPAKDSA